MLQKGCGGGVDEWPPRHLAPARRPDPARLHQHVERSPGDLHAPDRLDLGATDRLMIGDDRQRLDGGAGEPARLVPLAPEDMGHVRRRPDTPALATSDASPPPPPPTGSHSPPPPRPPHPPPAITTHFTFT